MRYLGNKDSIVDRIENLLESKQLINKNYVFAVIFYLVSVTFIIAQGLVPFVTIIAIGAMSICFLYKTYEFVVNKYCYIDAHIIIVYKEVLDQLLIQKGVVKQE